MASKIKSQLKHIIGVMMYSKLLLYEHKYYLLIYIIKNLQWTYKIYMQA